MPVQMPVSHVVPSSTEGNHHGGGGGGYSGGVSVSDVLDLVPTFAINTNLSNVGVRLNLEAPSFEWENKFPSVSSVFPPPCRPGAVDGKRETEGLVPENQSLAQLALAASRSPFECEGPDAVAHRQS